MELPFLVFMSGIALLLYWLGEKTARVERLVFKLTCFVLIVIISTIIANEGFSSTTGITPPINQTICLTVQNCTNGVNSTCSATNNCAYSYSGTGQFTVTKWDLATQGLAIMLQILAVYILITEGYLFALNPNRAVEE